MAGLGRKNWLTRLRFFGGCRRGVTAIETALILPLFLLLTFGTIEMGLLYFTASVIEGQISGASRQVRTGNVQASGNPIQAFRDLLCGGAGFFLTCDRAIIDVRRFATFGDVDYPDFVTEEGEEGATQFLPGNANDIILVRVAYRYDIVTPLLEDIIGEGRDFRMLYATTLLRNEPF